MASSATGGDRRWGSQRRGGMMVLGKVAVPKPINLPSQRLENYGVDPNVEIVPKGTLSWGSRPSSSSQNAWGSLPALSSSPIDGSVRHGLSNGRPSSGGSGTRPSTAGSEKSHDLVSGAWDGSSRPSSASGLLASSLSPGSLRPHSAEARPSSSPLSRFAESVGENSVAWGGSGHTERPSASSSFTLSSGDFPTLGSEKSSEANLQQGHSSHGRPSSSTSRGPQDKVSFASADDGYSNTTGEKGVSAWERDEPQYHTARSQPNIEKWREDSQEAMGYAKRNGPPQDFEQWHGPPFHNAPFHGPWYRGGPPPGPYGRVGPPGKYPVESPPFGFYHPQSQVPVQPMPNQQNSTKPGLAAGGPPNGDPYRPHLPESYPVLNHPVMPVRYPGPLLPYDNYSACEQSEKDSSVLGMAGGPRPCFYPRYPSQVVHPESGNLRGRPSGYGPATKGQAEASHVHDPGHRGPYKVLLKQHDELVASGAEEKKLLGSTQQLEKGKVQEASPNRKNDREADSIKGDKATENPKTTRDGTSSQPNLISETMQEHNVNETSLMIKQENAKKLEGTPLPVEKKNMTLIDKIESLNSKSRLPEGRNALGPLLPIREDTLKQSNNIGETSSGVACTEKDQRVNLTITPSPKEVSNVNRGDSSCEITFGAVPSLVDTTVEVLHEGAFPQGVAHGMQGNMDSKGRSRLSSQENENWKRRSAANSGSSHSVMKNFEVSSGELPEKQESNMPNMTENEFDSADYKAQRAKLKEIASQRAKQLQKEEDERTRDQKAKALAKLEELNRRTLGENVTCKPDSCKLQPKQEDAQMAEMRNVKSAVIDRQSCDSTQALNLSCYNSKKIAHKNSELHNNPATITTETSSLPVPEVAANILFGSTSQAVGKSYNERSQQMHDSGSLKQKVVDNSRRKNTSSGDSYQGDVLIATGHTDKVSFQADESASSKSIPVDNNSFGNEDSSGQHRKKHSRSFKSKHKVDDASRDSCVLASAPVEEKTINLSGESGNRRDAVTVVHEPKTVLVTNPSELQNLQEANQAAEKAVKKQIEGTQSKNMGNQGRLSSSRKALRNDQAVRPVEKSHGNEYFMWAPVQQPNKQQQSFERAGQVEGNQSSQSSGKAVIGFGNNVEGKCAEMEVEGKKSIQSSGKSVNGIGNNMKAKRAEMERYVPKLVAKDLSLQNNTQQLLLPSSLSSTSDEMGNPVKDVSEVGGTSSLPHTRNIESKHNKHGKKHASWRQRNANESRDGIVHSIEESAISFGVDTALEMTKDQRSLKLETESSKHQEHGDYMGEETDKVMLNVLGHGLATARGHVGSGRGRRQPIKLFKSGGLYQNVNEELNEDSGNGIPVKVGVDNIPVEARVQDSKINTAPKNNYGMGEIRPQWQPKYPKRQHVLNEIQQGNQGSGSQKITDGGMNPSTEDRSSHIRSAESPLLETHELNGAETSSSSCVETNLERTGKNLREESHKYPSKGATENFDHVEKQHFSLGRKQSLHGGRFQRGHRGSPYGGNGGWGGPMLEAHKQQAFLNGDQRKPPNSHFEYQPVEPHNNKKINNSFSGPTTTEEVRHEVSSSSGPRYKERGQSASKHGAHYHEKE